MPTPPSGDATPRALRPGLPGGRPRSSKEPPEGMLLLLLVALVLITLASFILARQPAAQVFTSLEEAQPAEAR